LLVGMTGMRRFSSRVWQAQKSSVDEGTVAAARRQKEKNVPEISRAGLP